MKKLLQKYFDLVLILSHTTFLLILINFFAWLWLESFPNEQENSNLFNIFNYPSLASEDPLCQMDSIELVQMLESFIDFKQSGQNEFCYHPATEFQLNQFSISGLSISKHESGFNIRNNNSNDLQQTPKHQVFCFGGSTTFGTFTKDQQSWPAFLANELDSAEVLNFGVPGFVPTQETAQFIYLMKQGYRPDAVIFMDGVNLGPHYDASDFTDIIASKFNIRDADFSIGDLAVIKLLSGTYKNQLDLVQTENVDFIPLDATSEYNDMLTNRFVENAKIRKQIAALYDIKILQFIQPNGNMNYPISFCNNFGREYFKNEGPQNMSKNLVDIFEKVLAANVGYIDLSSLFETFNKPSIIDIVHYTPEFNQFLAKEVTRHISLDLKVGPRAKKAATGTVYN
tara:strand:- start:37272 stop:38465 length:1194 start_codon:yes stop_codon:yes gene_type:complete